MMTLATVHDFDNFFPYCILRDELLMKLLYRVPAHLKPTYFKQVGRFYCSLSLTECNSERIIISTKWMEWTV